MKGLWKSLSPFAPDQSGATSVLCELGGLIVIIDAGGCAGNVCGFDEPRWFGKKSAIFSAGLRDMDAILGRDDRLVEKIVKACQKIEGSFVALVGTPVPAVIGTDYKALKRMIEVKTGIPVLTMDTSGVRYYDEGAEKAWLALFETFTEPAFGMEGNRLGILGATPFDVNMEGFDLDGDGKDVFASYLPGTSVSNSTTHFMENPGIDLMLNHRENSEKKYVEKQMICYGMGSGIEAVKQAATVTKNLVVAPSALKAARYLARRFGIPYEVGYPLETIKGYAAFLSDIKEKLSGETSKRILIVHQQVLAWELRKELQKYTKYPIVVADWFMMDKELRAPWDIPLKEEDQWISLVEEGNYDIIIGDALLKDAIPSYRGDFYVLNHFAVSGKPLEFVLSKCESF